MKPRRIPNWFVGEFLGTFIVVFFGDGAVCVSVTTGAQTGIFEVAIVWGLAIAIAIQLTRSLSGAHLNPAVTLTLATWKRFPGRRVLPYVATQMLGAFTAAAVLYGIFGAAIRQQELASGISRGNAGSEASAMVFAEYFPSPGGKALTPEARTRVSHTAAVGAEIVGTAILLIVILGVTDERKPPRLRAAAPYSIGLTVTLLISVIGPLTMACFNPARDLAPRIFTALAGWGSWPFQANGIGWLTVYVLAPMIGAFLAGAIHERWIVPGYPEAKRA